MEIVTYQQRIGTVTYISGDKIEVDVLLRRQLLNDDVVAGLRRRKEIAEPTVESMAVAIARRPGGSPWPPRGWTQAELEERGFVDPQPAPLGPVTLKATKVGVKEEPAPTTPAPAHGDKIERIELTDEAVQVGEHFLQPTRRGAGNLKFWSAARKDGTLLRPQLFNSLAKGRAWIEGLSTTAAEPDTPGSQTKEPADGGDVRSSAADGQG